MELSHPKATQKESILLEEGSLIVFSDEARFKWRHAIPARKSDQVNGVEKTRKRRVSLTFRNVLLTS